MRLEIHTKFTRMCNYFVWKGRTIDHDEIRLQCCTLHV